jgi:hypothetical protein
VPAGRVLASAMSPARGHRRAGIRARHQCAVTGAARPRQAADGAGHRAAGPRAAAPARARGGSPVRGRQPRLARCGMLGRRWPQAGAYWTGRWGHLLKWPGLICFPRREILLGRWSACRSETTLGVHATMLSAIIEDINADQYPRSRKAGGETCLRQYPGLAPGARIAV